MLHRGCMGSPSNCKTDVYHQLILVPILYDIPIVCVVVVKQLLKAHESAIRKKNKVAFPTETGKAIPAASSLPPGYNQGIDLAVRYAEL